MKKLGWLCLFSFYVALLSPYIGFGDSGSLALSAIYLTGAHPPGYAAILILQKLFTFLPVGSAAFRLHIFSAFFFALSFPFALSLLHLEQNHLLWSAVLLFPLYLFPELLRYLLQVEVYGFTLFLFLALLFFIQKEGSRAIYLLFFLFSFFYHPYFFLLLVCFVAPRLRNRRTLFLSLGFLLLGFAHLLFYFFRNGADPTHRFAFSFAYTFLDYFSARGFQEFSLPRLAEIGKLFPVLTPFYPFLFLLPLACLSSLKPRKGYALLALLTLLFSLPAFLSFDFVPYLFPLLFSIQLLALPLSSLSRSRWAQLCLALFLFGSLIAWQKPLKEGMFAGNSFLYRYRRRVLASLPPATLLILPNRSTFYSFAFLYDRYIQQQRTDITLFYPMYGINPAYLASLPLSPQEKSALQQSFYPLTLSSFLPQKFFSFLFQESPWLHMLNRLTHGKIVWEIGNHQRNIQLALALARHYQPSYFADKEIMPYPLFFCRGVFAAKRCLDKAMFALLLSPPKETNSQFLSAHLLAQIEKQSLSQPLPRWLVRHPEYRLALQGEGFSITQHWLEAFRKKKKGASAQPH